MNDTREVTARVGRSQVEGVLYYFAVAGTGIVAVAVAVASAPAYFKSIIFGMSLSRIS